MEMIPNPERGCGHLKDDNGYIRSDVDEYGVLPSFVEFKRPIPCGEYMGSGLRGYEKINGIEFELSVDVGTKPEGEIYDHIDRLKSREKIGEKDDKMAGDLSCWMAHDLIMGVGESYYPEPEDYISEAKRFGINKGISITKNKEPPRINSGVTRIFVWHPSATKNDQGAIIGYGYATRAIYVVKEEGKVPRYIREYASNNRLDLVVKAPEISKEDL